MKLLSTLLLTAMFTAGCATAERAPPQFRAGDMALARNFTHHPHLNGTPVLVTGDFTWRWIKGGNTLKCYAIKTADGQELAAQNFQLQPLAGRAL
jgi:hypothetical protein